MNGGVEGAFLIHNKSVYCFFVVLFVVAIGFFLAVSLEQRNYQDLWILEDLVVPTGVFLSFFFMAETFVKKNKTLVLLAAFLLAALNVIPGLKYQWFLNVYDAPAHYRFTEQIASLGYVPENEPLSRSYGGNPGLHVFMATISILTGFSTNDVLRLIIPALSGLVPFIVYFTTKGSLDDRTQRYVIIASSFPIIQRYGIYGTGLAMLPYFLLIALYLRALLTKANQIALWLMFSVLSFSLVISHAITSIFLAFVLVGALVVSRFLESARKKPLGQLRASQLAAPCLFHVVLLFAWWANASSFNMNRLGVYIGQAIAGDPYRSTIPSRFQQMPFLPRLQVLTVEHLRDAILAILSLFGILVFMGKLKRNEASDEVKTFYSFLIVLLSMFALLLSFEFASGFGSIEYGRFIAYALPLCTFLVGLTLWRLNGFLHSLSVKPIIRDLTFGALLFLLVALSLVQFYSYQPLIPKSDVLSSDLPENEYLYYLGLVNTIYQVEMISFADRHSLVSSITSDAVTRYQIRGFSSPSFSSRHLYYRYIYGSPLEPDYTAEWDLLLLHTLRAGPLNEAAEYRTREHIESIRLEAGNLLYDNGESFIVAHFSRDS